MHLNSLPSYVLCGARYKLTERNLIAIHPALRSAATMALQAAMARRKLSLRAPTQWTLNELARNVLGVYILADSAVY